MFELVDQTPQSAVIKVIGVGVAVPPWNFPLSLLGGMVAAAVVTCGHPRLKRILLWRE